MKLIEEGMADIASKSCIKFRPRAKDGEHAVVIQVALTTTTYLCVEISRHRTIDNSVGVRIVRCH